MYGIKMTTNVLIVTEGSKKIGFGHITRCMGLYEAFEEKGVDVKFILNSDETVEALVENKDYIIFNWIKNPNKLFNMLKDANVVIIDSYMANPKLYEKFSELVDVPVYLDDDKRMEYPKGTVVNGSIHAKYMNYPKKENVEYLIGTDYIPLRNEFWNIKQKLINNQLKSIMITFGGDDSRNMSPLIMNSLNNSYPKLEKKVIIGKAFKNIEMIENMNLDKVELFYYPDAEGMKNIMLESDIAISAGGQTLYELARVNIPTIAVIVASNQINNVNYWQKTGFIECAGFWNDENLFDTIINKIEYLTDKNVREKKAWIGLKHVNGLGAANVVNHCLGKLALKI